MRRNILPKTIDRRGVLKGASIAGIAGVTGIGALQYSSEPVAAVDGEFTAEDISVEVSDGEVSLIGIEALWFELEWQGIDPKEEYMIEFSFRTGDGVTVARKALDDIPISGSDTWGYGEEYEANFNNELTDENVVLNVDDFENPIPIRTESNIVVGDLSLDEQGQEETFQVDFEIGLREGPPSAPGSMVSSKSQASFNVTVSWPEADAEVTEGFTEPYAED